MQLSEYEKKALDAFCKSVQDDKWTNTGLVELLKRCGDFLNLQTIPDYARDQKLSYPGVVKTRQIEPILNVKFVIDNE